MIAAAVAAATTAFLAPAAQAAPPGCSAAFEQFNNERSAGLGKSRCDAGLQYVVVTCYRSWTNQYYKSDGPWVGPGQTSTAQCAQLDYAIGADVHR